VRQLQFRTWRFLFILSNPLQQRKEEYQANYCNRCGHVITARMGRPFKITLSAIACMRGSGMRSFHSRVARASEMTFVFLATACHAAANASWSFGVPTAPLHSAGIPATRRTTP